MCLKMNSLFFLQNFIKSGIQNLSEQGRKWLFNKFMNPRTYDLGKQGRLAFNKKFKIAVFLPQHDGIEYWLGPLLGIKKAGEEFERFGVKMEYINYIYSSAAFKKAAQKVLEGEYDGLLFAPIFYDESVLFLKEFKKV